MSYTLAPLARLDLHDILVYVRRDNPYAAKRIRSALLAAGRRLAEHPGIGHTRADLTELPLRFLTVRERYLMAYRERARGIEVVRIFGPGRDVSALL